MGKVKRHHNSKARVQRKHHDGTNSLPDVELLIPELKADKYDDCNALITSNVRSSKRNMLLKSEQFESDDHQFAIDQPPGATRRHETPKLTKKQRRRLEQIVRQKAKKRLRSDVFASLAAHQIGAEEMEKMISTVDVTNCVVADRIQGHIPKRLPFKVNPLGGKNKRKRQIRTSSSSSDDSNYQPSSSERSSDNENDDQELTNPNECSLDTKDTAKNVESSFDHVDQASKPTVCAASQPSHPIISEHEHTKATKTNVTLAQKSVYIAVKRSAEIQALRMQLPILGEEQQIMEAIRENPVLVLCGETGCGKTTQVPQFLYEAGYAHQLTTDGRPQLIGVTEPRRIAAVSMSHRIAVEMGLTQDEVSYQIRYEGNVTDKTRIKFMTDGVLLKHLEEDFLLSDYRVLVIDEAHERSVHTDILIGLLSRIVPLRWKRNNPLTLVIMSATLRIEDFTHNQRLFPKSPPVIHIKARQFPVTVHFNRRTGDDYLAEAFRKVVKINRLLPPGGILLFVTGQREVVDLCKRLRRYSEHNIFRKVRASNIETPETPPEINLDQYSAIAMQHGVSGNCETKKSDKQRKRKRKTEILNLQSAKGTDACLDKREELEIYDEQGRNLDSTQGLLAEEQEAVAQVLFEQRLHVLPLYGNMSQSAQAHVFRNVPTGRRLCVVATNVAETSITIPNIRYVVDTGRVKNKLYDRLTGVSRFEVSWTSRASADQRAGRAGRTAPGHCYRLYSSAIFQNEFPEFSQPEIFQKPAMDLVLLLKSLHIDRVENFAFPTNPSPDALVAAEAQLIMLGALERQNLTEKGASLTKITRLGRMLSKLPVSARCAKMICLASRHRQQPELLKYAICLVSALSVGGQLLADDGLHEAEQPQNHFVQLRRTWLLGDAAAPPASQSTQSQCYLLGDLAVMLKVIGAARVAEAQRSLPDFCLHNGVRFKAAQEALKLRRHLTEIAGRVFPHLAVCSDNDQCLTPPTSTHYKLLRQIVLACCADLVCRLKPADENGSETEAERRTRRRAIYEAMFVEGSAYVHSCSVLANVSPIPEFIVALEMFEPEKRQATLEEQALSVSETEKPESGLPAIYLRQVAAVEVEWLPVYGKYYHRVAEKPASDDEPQLNEAGEVTCRLASEYGPRGWRLPIMELPYPDTLDKYRWFARFLLDGQVVPALATYRPKLLGLSSVMLKSWAKLQPRTDALLRALVAKHVATRRALLDVWAADPHYLLPEYLQWLPESLHSAVTAAWPPCAES